jgi:hypothetical protein
LALRPGKQRAGWIFIKAMLATETRSPAADPIPQRSLPNPVRAGGVLAGTSRATERNVVDMVPAAVAVDAVMNHPGRVRCPHNA